MSKRFIRQKEQREKRKIARERIDVLFTLAERVFPYEPELANRYVGIALAVQQKAKIRMPRKWKRRYCRKCHSFLVPGGKNARVRLRDKPYPPRRRQVPRVRARHEVPVPEGTEGEEKEVPRGESKRKNRR